MHFTHRAITKHLLDSLENSPCVFLNGPRQAGKSTLAHHLAKKLNADYITFDDIQMLSAAIADPQGFLSGIKNKIVIDEIQMAPVLFRLLKKTIDELRLTSSKKANGKFLLTGSANVMALPALSDALVGRMQVWTLYPFSAGEVSGYADGFVDFLFNHPIGLTKNAFEPFVLHEIAIKASFPEISSLSATQQHKWFDNYLLTLVQRDVRNVMDVEKIEAIPLLIRLLATRAGTTAQDASISSEIGLNKVTYARYKAILHHLFLFFQIQPWFNNLGKRLVKTPKLYFTDTAQLCHLLGVQAQHVKMRDPTLYGRILENFVASELHKQLSWQTDYNLYHFRTHDQKEVDFIIEHRDGTIIAIEVKSRGHVLSEDFSTIRFIHEHVKTKFKLGIVLYQGNDIVPFGEKYLAMPISALWQLGHNKI